MAWYRCGGGGVPASLKNDMNVVLNKKFHSLDDYDPKEWPELTNLLGKLPEATVNGSIVTFSDGADDVPLKSCVVTLPASLDGYSSVDVVQTGKNFIDFPDNLTSSTSGGITFSKASNGGITYSGTATGTFAYITPKFDFKIPSGKQFTLSRDTALNFRHYIQLTFSDDTTASVVIDVNNTSVTYTPAKDVIAVRLIMSQLTVQTEYSGTVYIQIEFNSSATVFEAYNGETHTANLGRTIHGGSADIVNGEGKDGFTSILISETTWTYDSANSRFISANLRGMKNVAIRTLHVMAYGYETIDDARPVGNVPDQAIYNANYERRVIIHDSNYTNVSDFLTAKGNVSIIYPLATPTDFTFEPVEISSKLGDNTMWSDGDMEVTYRRDIDLTLGGQ